MSENCFVIERIEWGEKLDEKRVPYDRYEYHDLCRVCHSFMDAKAFVEQNAGQDPYGMEWHGFRSYSGSFEDEDSREGLKYILHSLALY